MKKERPDFKAVSVRERMPQANVQSWGMCLVFYNVSGRYWWSGRRKEKGVSGGCWRAS